MEQKHAQCWGRYKSSSCPRSNQPINLPLIVNTKLARPSMKPPKLRVCVTSIPNVCMKAEEHQQSAHHLNYVSLALSCFFAFLPPRIKQKKAVARRLSYSLYIHRVTLPFHRRFCSINRSTPNIFILVVCSHHCNTACSIFVLHVTIK